MSKMTNKEIYIKYKPSEVKRILQSKTFWKSVKYFHNLFGLENDRYDSLGVYEARNALEKKCARLSCDIDRPGGKHGFKSTEDPEELFIDRMDWWGYVISMTMDYIFTFCDITEQSVGEKAANKIKYEQLSWEICWEEAIAKCILQPKLKNYFYHKTPKDKLVKRLFTIMVEDSGVANKEKIDEK